MASGKSSPVRSLYHYRAIVTSVYDGDTCTVDIDLGMGVWLRGEKVRLVRINAPELRGITKVTGRAARDYLRSLIDGKEIVLQTVKDRKGKYGRYLGEIWIQQSATKLINVNDAMVKAGQAEYRKY